MKDRNIDDPFYLQIQREINRIEGKADTYNRLFYLIRILQIGLTGTVTVLSGLNKDQTTYGIWILILSAIVTAITAVDTLFQVSAKKDTYKLVLFELRSIRAEIVYELMQTMPEKSESKWQLPENTRKRLFEKYRTANSYARDLIGTDTE